MLFSHQHALHASGFLDFLSLSIVDTSLDLELRSHQFPD